MSPAKAGQSVASWWGALSDASKALVAAAGTVGVLATAIVTLSGWLSIPSRVEALEAQSAAQHARDAVQDSAITAQGNGMEYLICDRLTSQGMEYRGRHTQQECAADIIAPGRP